jgi:hypothetical protein
MTETEFYIAITLVSASAAAALTAGFLATRKANMTKATILLLSAGAVVWAGGLLSRDQPQAGHDVPAVQADTPAGKSATPLAPAGRRKAPPPRRCSMVAYLVI